MRESRGRFRDQSGFTLVEVLVAFTVMATLLSVLFRAVVTMHAGAMAFDYHTRQQIVARAVMDDALVKRNLESGTYKGIRDGCRWKLVATSINLTVQVPPHPSLTSDHSTADSSDRGETGWASQRLVVRVYTNGRPLKIETMRLVKRGERR